MQVDIALEGDYPPLEDNFTFESATLLEKLDTELKNYKSNSIKGSIIRGHDDLGDHYFECGDLNNALKCYSRARDYCTTAKHVVNMCVNVIKALQSLLLGSTNQLPGILYKLLLTTVNVQSHSDRRWRFYICQIKSNTGRKK
ncbi:unnamed protein product [Pocillopora meandrina]|uniref:26S proteasome regulatory subunit Rpn7 N-terminal domain-containing protein n=1 Tax=Pocillopora meandrina TaxID=46732 RepID=A0AAU9X640_9CNID|nr:unnamed protein product [Pocillopora meandrina]